MVSITFTTGPLSGQSHQVEKNDPIKFLLNIVQQKWDWKLDFCLSNETEIFIWTRADMVARIIRALIQGRSIIFDGQIFSLENNPYIKELIENIEDTIVQSGYNVYVAKDDENGVLIEIAGTENPIQ